MSAFFMQNKIAIIVALFCIPLALKKIGPNGLYGFRFGKALEGTDQWYRVNQIGALCVIGALAVGVIVKLLLQQGSASSAVLKYSAMVDTISLAVGLLLTVGLTGQLRDPER